MIFPILFPTIPLDFGTDKMAKLRAWALKIRFQTLETGSFIFRERGIRGLLSLHHVPSMVSRSWFDGEDLIWLCTRSGRQVLECEPPAVDKASSVDACEEPCQVLVVDFRCGGVVEVQAFN